MKYYSGRKGNEVLVHAPAWINFENSVLSVRSQMQKTTYCIMWWIWIGKSIETEKKADLCLARGRGGSGKQGVAASGYSFGSDEYVLKLNCANGCTRLCEYPKNNWIVPFKWTSGIIWRLCINKTVENCIGLLMWRSDLGQWFFIVGGRMGVSLHLRFISGVRFTWGGTAATNKMWSFRPYSPLRTVLSSLLQTDTHTQSLVQSENYFQF